MIRVIVLFLILVVNIVLQSTVIQSVDILGVSMNLLLITSVSFGLLRGKLEGAIIGFCLGILQDLFFGYVIGFYGLLYLYVGFVAGFFNKSFYRDGILVPISIMAACDLFVNLAIYIFTFLFRGRLDFFDYFVNIILKEVIYTTFLSLFIYKVYFALNKKIEFFEVKREDA